MQNLSKISNGVKGVTLIETVLAMSLVALILSSLTVILSVSLKSWELSDEKDELVQNGRVAMDRIISDLRYAISFTQSSGGVLEFETKYLEDKEAEKVKDDIEIIKYEKSGSSIYRSVDSQASSEIAAYVDSFGITLLDADGDKTTDSVIIKLKLKSGDDTFTLTSTAYMRI